MIPIFIVIGDKYIVCKSCVTGPFKFNIYFVLRRLQYYMRFHAVASLVTNKAQFSNESSTVIG